MTDDFTTLTTRIATAIATTGLRIPSDGSLPDNVNPPCALLTPTNGEALSLDESSTTETFELLAIVQQSGSRHSSNANVAPFLARTGTSSIRAALRTGLGGDLIRCDRRQVGAFEVDGTVYFGARFELEVISQ